MFLSAIRRDKTKRDRESGKTEKNIYYIKYYINYIILHKNSVIRSSRKIGIPEMGGTWRIGWIRMRDFYVV